MLTVQTAHPVWESEEDAKRFFNARPKRAFEAVGVSGPPPQPQIWQVHNGGSASCTELTDPGSAAPGGSCIRRRGRRRSLK